MTEFGLQLVPHVLAGFGQGTLDTLMEDEDVGGSLCGRIVDLYKGQGE